MAERAAPSWKKARAKKRIDAMLARHEEQMALHEPGKMIGLADGKRYKVADDGSWRRLR